MDFDFKSVEEILQRELKQISVLRRENISCKTVYARRRLKAEKMFRQNDVNEK
jgi:hypothetical protein